ncbi:MAG: hypothetical protein BRC31_07200 [Actinobacteria bacterium QS_5_72_10]|nr:MAG: hypothetical protein BRC31_07200 [Actinobacteria bacterium QS_5_72_10]
MGSHTGHHAPRRGPCRPPRAAPGVAARARHSPTTPQPTKKEHAMRRRMLLGLAALALGLAACTAGSPAPDSESSDDAAAGATAGELVGGVDPAAREQAIAAAEDFDPFAHTDSDTPPWPWELAARGVDVPAMVPLDELRSGGPPPDGIPPIDDPQFESVAAADEWLTDRDPVLLIEHGNAVRAYPLAILTFHEVVNDVVAGDPLLVTYCPLCNSALAFEHTLDGEVVEFGTSGRLWRSNLVMYDRATRSLWLQFTGEAIVGARVGDQLERLPLQMAAWGDVAQRWPDAEVLSRDTGHDRPYGENPYVGYDEGGSPMLFGDDTGSGPWCCGRRAPHRRWTRATWLPATTWAPRGCFARGSTAAR